MRNFPLLLLAILCLLSSFLGAQNQADISGDYLIIQLVTIDPGDELTMWWGHTGIIVRDTRLNAASFYNYGLFSFEQDNFVLNFIRGRLIFWVGVWDAQLALDFYRNMNRTIRIQTLDLTPDKKREMAVFLARNVLPQNREYLYDHYADNCATRLRDLIDHITDGQFAVATKVPGRMTLRELTRRHTHRNYFMDWVLMFLMNDSIDQPIRKWDEMFLPSELERNFSGFSYVDTLGIKRNLVADSFVYHEATDVYLVPEEVPVHWPAGLIVGLILGTLLIISAIIYSRRTRSLHWLFPALVTLSGLVFGVPGFTLFMLSAFTDHTVTYWNENLLLGNPLTLLLAALGITLFFAKYKVRDWHKYVIHVLTGSAVLLVFLKLLPVFDQDNLLSICIILPVLMSLSYIWWKILPVMPGE